MLGSENSEQYQVVLTADRSFFSEYHHLPFLKAFCFASTRFVYPPLFYRFIAPHIPKTKTGSAHLAPYHTRRTEAALLNNGFQRNEVVVVVPEKVVEFLSPKTRIVSISVRDPLSKIHHYSLLNPSNRESFSNQAFRESLLPLQQNRKDLKIIVEGPGAWQLTHKELLDHYGIDHVIIGESTTNDISLIFQQLAANKNLPAVIRPSKTPFNHIPIIRGGVLEGRIEVARGCNRHCRFCNVPRVQSRPLEEIIAEAKINVQSGQSNISFRSDDIFNYGAKGLKVNKKAVVNLYKSVTQILGIQRVGQCYLALASVAAYPELIAEISDIINVGSAEYPFTTVLSGVESGSSRLMHDLMPGKTRPFTASQWHDVVLESIAILHEHNWVPTAMFILGLPGEQNEDVESTITLIERLRPYRSILAPFVFKAKSALCKMRDFNIADLQEYHLELIKKVFLHNRYWGPKIIKTQLFKQTYLHWLLPFITPFITWGFNRIISKWMDSIRRALTRN